MSIWYTAQQPVLFPPLYLMERMARVQHWVILEEAQFDRDCVQLTIANNAGVDQRTPATGRCAEEIRGKRTCFDEMRVINPDLFARKLLLTAQMNYARCDGYKAIRPWLVDLMWLVSRHESVNAICQATLDALERLLVLDTVIHQSRQMVPQRPAEPTAWMASFCSHLHATDYVQGRKASEAYFLKGPFEDQSVRTWGQEFDCFYETVGGRRADAKMSALDALCVLGVEQTRKMLLVEQGKGDIGTVVELRRD